MANHIFYRVLPFDLVTILFFVSILVQNSLQDILGCGGFLKSHVSIDFSKVEVKLYTKQGTLKESSDCAPTNGYYFIPIYDKGEYSLKIEPPAGWFFEPKEVHLNFDGVNDPCSKSNDINFFFKGFTIQGKVISARSTDGPESVIVNLESETDKTIKLSTTTAKNGYFQFTPVVQGNYVITVKHERFKFLKDAVRISVKEENLEVPINSLVVAGYSISGQVLFGGEPTKGVTFVLSSNDEQNQDLKLKECSTEPLKNFKYKGYICHVNSDENGIFVISSVPPGSYKIRPHYIKFDVHPEEINVIVKHNHVVLSEKFLVKGFSVSGQVLTSVGGSSISNAVIYLNGKEVAVTDRFGKYNLDSMEPGSYVLSVHSDNMNFEEKTVKVSPNTPEIENIYPSEFKICGTVTPSSGQQTRIVEILHSETGAVMEVSVDRETRKFCKFLKPGSYILKVKISEFEKSTGMQYLPVSKDIQVRNSPINDIAFTQLRGNIKGRIIKLPEAQKAVELSVKLKLKNSLFAMKVLEGNDLSYSFNDVMPGYYDVELENNQWCFQNDVHSISVSSLETSVPDFVQTGFKIKIWSSHQTSAVIISNIPEKNFKKNLQLNRGENVICVPYAAAYKVQPTGCHGYQNDFYIFNVKDEETLKLNAISHDVSGFVKCFSLENDLLINVTLPNGHVTQLGPLRGEKSENSFMYKFVYRIKGNQFVKFTPISSKLLFQPEVFEYRTINDCSKNAIQFVGEKGLIIEGAINPPLSNVTITLKITDLIPNQELIYITEANGKYKFGPLRSTTNYQITAEKKSYVLSGPDKKGDFKAHKLAEINVKVLDNTTQEPLQGVLLSLTGGEKYRKNSMTEGEGLLSFHSLSPGEYFLRPMMKEYKFEPSSQIIQIKEGVTEFIELRGRRVSFSAYGVVTTLNNDPESRVVIEAAGINACSNLQEEASSETNGQFRIRGLLPQCEYQIRLKKGPDVNLQIHRIAPQDLIVRTNQGDVRDIQLIAFQFITLLDLSVHVESTIPEHLKTLKVKLFKEDSPDSPVYVIKLDTLGGGVKNWGSPSTQERFLKPGLFVQFPYMMRDKASYFVQIESTLNKHSYTYKETVAHFVANKTYRSLKLTFDPVPKIIDQEFSQSNYFILILLIFSGLTYTYFNKIVPVVQNFFGSLNQTSFNFSRDDKNLYNHNSANDSVLIEPVGVSSKRKMKPRKA